LSILYFIFENSQQLHYIRLASAIAYCIRKSISKIQGTPLERKS